VHIYFYFFRYENMQGTFNFIPAIAEKSKQRGKVLTEDENKELFALKEQRRALNEEIHKLDPNAGLTGRAKKRNDAMGHLLKLSEMNKEVKRVGWANSGESVKRQFELDAQKPKEKRIHEGWDVHDTRDITGDGIPDVIVYDETGAVRIVNGNTITKSKYPERQQYYSEYPDPQTRRAVRNRETGEPINYKIDENGNKYDHQYTSYGNFKNKYKNVEVENGVPRYTNAQTARLKKLTPWSVFINVIMKKYWTAIKESNLINDIPKPLKMRFYGLLKKYTWYLIKNHVISERLNLNIPEKKEQREYIEKSNNFKEALYAEITDILKIEPEEMFTHFDDAFDAAKNYLYGEAAHEERMAKRKPRKAKSVNKNISENTARNIWSRSMAAYGVNEEENPFEDVFNTWKRADQGMEFAEYMDALMTEAFGGRANEEEDDEGNWLD